MGSGDTDTAGSSTHQILCFLQVSTAWPYGKQEVWGGGVGSMGKETDTTVPLGVDSQSGSRLGYPAVSKQARTPLLYAKEVNLY